MKVFKGIMIGLGIVLMALSFSFLTPGLTDYTFIDYKAHLAEEMDNYEDLSEAEIDELWAQYVEDEHSEGVLTFIIFISLGAGILLTIVLTTVLKYYESKKQMLTEFNKYTSYKSYDLDHKIKERRELTNIDIHAVNHLSRIISDAAPMMDSKSMQQLTKIVDDYLKKNT